MRRILKILLITIGVILLIYGIYFILGRPAIPLPAFKYPVTQGSQLYDIVKATESDKVKVTLATNGEVKALDDEKDLLNISFTAQSLNNAIFLGTKYVALPEKTQNTIDKITKILPGVRKLPYILVEFFYHVIRFRLTLNVTAI